MKRARGRSMQVVGWLAAVLVSQAVCIPVLAALGGDAATVENDRQHMKGQLRTTVAAAGYTVHEIQTATNTVVREYVSGGKVFAVSWNGPLLPDLNQTLGAYFTQYVDATSAPHVGHRHLSIDQSDLVVHSSGHMRAFYGHAYVPSLLPPNFSIADIK